jgi:uncharacterized protein (TIGR00255 family)
MSAKPTQAAGAAGAHHSSEAHASAATPKKASSLRSMTGYAQARASESGWALRISVRSVNHRFLDLHLRMPDGFEALEPRIRQIVRERVRRGHLDVTVRYEPVGPAAIKINEEAAAAYVQAANSLRKQFGIATEPDLAQILRLPGVIGPPASSGDGEVTQLDSAVSRCLTEALDHLDRMREEEAAALSKEMSGRLAAITALAEKVKIIAMRARPAFTRRLELRLKELLGDAPIDPARIAQEAAIAGERADVAEELARLESHVQQFGSLLASSSDVGKKLDFLLQEMQRETNTLLSKTPGIEAEGLEITQLGLEIKSEIEKLREQVQNIE